METAQRERLAIVVRDLQQIFGERLEAVVGYGRRPHDPAPCLALVASLTNDDLGAMAAVSAEWHRAGAATPLVLPRDEFAQALDIFPIEYGEIIETHVPLYGRDPFEGSVVDPLDVRRAVEVLARSHLLHLRENFIEQGGRPASVELLVRDSAPSFAVLLRRMARLDGQPADSSAALSHWASTRAGLDPRVVGDLLALAGEVEPPVDAVRLFPAYLATVRALVHAVDQWRVD